MRARVIFLTLMVLVGPVAWLWPSDATADVFVLKSGRRIEGTVTDEGDKYQIVTPDGAKMHWPKNVVREIIEDKQAEPAPESEIGIEGGSKEQGKSAVEVDLGGESKVRDKTGLLEVVVTGLGLSPEKALENAFTRAVEQAIGVFVDAETLVKNDEILRERVLTHSRGFVKHYDVVRRWQTEGLHHASIRAKVRVDKLVERLKAADVTVKEVSGSDLFAEATTRVKRTESGAALMRKVFQHFPANVLSVAVQRSPRIIEATEQRAKVGVKVRFSLDEQKYRKWLSDSEQVFRQLATKTKRVMWNPAKEGKPLSKMDWVEELAIPPEKRKSNEWGSLSIAREQWGYAYYVGGFRCDWFPRADVIQYGLAVASRPGSNRVTLYFFESQIQKEIVKATCQVPFIHMVLRNARGNTIDGYEGIARFETSSYDTFFASPMFVVERPFLCSAWPGIEQGGRLSDQFFVSRRLLAICPYLQYGSVDLLTPCFCKEFAFEMPRKHLKDVASVEVKIANRNLLARSARGAAEVQ